MRRTFILPLTILILALTIYPQCEETSRQNTGEKIAAKEFSVSAKQADSVFVLDLEASANGTTWMSKDAQAAVVTIFVDGKYNQDITLFQGATAHKYQVVLGKMSSGKHSLEIVRNAKRSALQSGGVTIKSTRVVPFVSSTKDDLKAISYSPFIFARPDTIGRFSDIPILTYYEVLPVGSNRRIRFTTIFSNEDGGTQTAALLARWGRTTDIEWVYELEVENDKVTAERFQGANHVTTSFSGNRLFGSHPAIFNVTVNNNFAAVGWSPIRTALLPIKVDLSRKSRETVMDENPWTYRIMAFEAIREGRINPQMMNANTIADPRDYVYAEVYNEPTEAAVSLAASAKDRQFSSDGGQRLLRVDRGGFVRIAFLLPRENRKSAVDFSLLCHAKSEASRSGKCRNAKLLRIITLDGNFFPRITPVSAKSHDLQVGEKANFKVKFSRER